PPLALPALPPPPSPPFPYTTLFRSPPQVALFLQPGEVAVDRGTGAQAYGLADLPHRRRVAPAFGLLGDEVHDFPLALGQVLIHIAHLVSRRHYIPFPGRQQTFVRNFVLHPNICTCYIAGEQVFATVGKAGSWRQGSMQLDMFMQACRRRGAAGWSGCGAGGGSGGRRARGWPWVWLWR